MATRLLPERVPITSEDLSAEVTRCASWSIQQDAVRLWAAFLRAPDGSVAERNALREFYGLFVDEAQPTWDIIDHRGVVLATVAGMERLNHLHVAGLILEWAATLRVSDPPSAVDALMPEGPLRDELNRHLKASRKAA